MNVLIILGHPNKKSFNQSIAETCKEQIESNGHSVYFHDLYAENFNPLLHIDNENSDTPPDNQVKLHCNNLINSDGIIIIHPNWWGQPPAIIKGWMDRVLIPEVAYRFEQNDKGEFVPVGLLKAEVGIVINTSNSPTTSENDVLDSIWKKNTLTICGINEVKRIHFGKVSQSDDAQRAKWLLEVKQLVNTLFPTLK